MSGVFGRHSVYQDNPSGSPQAPTVNSDVNAGFTVGSRWYDTRLNIIWYCIDATAGAAKWVPQSSGILGSLIGANMNATTDQPFKTFYDLTKGTFAVSKILATNASLSMTTAAGGIYSAAAKGGSAIVAAGQAYTGLTVATSLLSLTIATAGSNQVFSVAPILSLTTPQGAAATADFYLVGDYLPQN